MQFRQSPITLALLLALSPAVTISTYANAAEIFQETADKTQRGERFKQMLETAQNGTVIKLEGDTALLRGEGYLTINKNITIDGNGHQLHIEGSNLSLEADVTIKNTNLSLKSSQTLDSIFGGGFNTQNATPSVIVTNGHKLVLDAVDTKVSGAHDDSRPIIILGSKDDSTQNAGHGELVVTNSAYKTKLYAVVAGGNGTNDQNQPTKITLEKGVSFVGKSTRGTDEGVVVGTFNGKSYTGDLDLVIAENDQNLKTFDTSTNPNVSLTLTNGLSGDGILNLGEKATLKNLTLDSSKSITVEKLTVTENLTLKNGAVLQTPNFPKTASQINLNNIKVESGEIKAEEKSGQKANLTISGNIEGDLKIVGNDVKLNENYQLNSQGKVVAKTTTPTQPQIPPTDSNQGEINQGETGQSNEPANENEQGNSNEVTPPPTTEPKPPLQPEEPVVSPQPEQPSVEPTQPPVESEQPSVPVVPLDPVEPPVTPSEPADNSQGENGSEENTDTTTNSTPDAPIAGEETPPSSNSENGNASPSVEPPKTEMPNTNEDPNNAGTIETPSENNGATENNDTTGTGTEAGNNSPSENSGEGENAENQESNQPTTEQPIEETAQEVTQEEKSHTEEVESKEDKTEQAQESTSVETVSKVTALPLISAAEIAYHQSAAKAIYALTVSSQAMNGLNKRLNQLRAYDSHQDLSAALNSAAVPFTGESGLWVSIQSQRLKQHHDYKLRHWGVQIGYDATLPIESGLLRLGGAVDMANGQIRLTESRDELRLRDYGAALYGSYETEKGQYVDAIARAARISVKNPVQHFRYHHNLYSASVAYGQRFQLTPYWVLDPYGQLAYHHLSAADYHQNQLAVKRDAVNSLVASLGIKSAVQIKPNLQLYIDAALYRELAGKQKLFLTHDAAPSDILRQDWSNHATWGVVGVGIQAKWTPNFYWSTELNHVIGNGYKQSYQAQVNVNWLF
ncbi:autotransporter domain-containing protein [uncultured Actinobacillus sp.]|uniref:autotransporter domain-containing protein n=1 Tax=uncultured Actinobacillus sp. TaxID=417616 RepID=UPI0025E459AD|nr:autotransporter domain-containing protein [uncultured Actinobacillus sp.]